MPGGTHSPVDADARIAGSLDFEPMTRQPSTVPPRAPRPLLLEWALAGSATMTACLFTNPSEVSSIAGGKKEIPFGINSQNY